jgi:hypothetical protein
VAVPASRRDNPPSTPTEIGPTKSSTNRQFCSARRSRVSSNLKQ